MATIKCEYIRTYCSIYGRYDYKEVFHNEDWFCDSNEWCEFGKYERPVTADKKLINPVCKHCQYKTVRFEKSYKQYELSIDKFHDGYLEIGKKTIDLYAVKYLEIDGKVYINEEETK